MSVKYGEICTLDLEVDEEGAHVPHGQGEGIEAKVRFVRLHPAGQNILICLRSNIYLSTTAHTL